MKPMLFNTAMVKKLLDRQKTATRRVVKPQPPATAHVGKIRYSWYWSWWEDSDSHQMKPPYFPGDILYVREAFQQNYDGSYSYRAGHKFEKEGGWRPSIHMPKEAARIFLRVTDVRVERLQEITEMQTLEEEGVQVDFPQPKPSYMSLAYTETKLKPAVRKAFADLWDSTIKKSDRDKYGWNANPWVWVIEFERITQEEALESEVSSR